MYLRLILAAALFLAAGALPAHAVDPNANFEIARLRAATPACYDNDGPVVGTVAGYFGAGDGQRSASIVGCFDSPRQCEAWRRQTSGAVDGRIIYDRCEPR